jgi:hypothetical protein
VNDDDFPTEVCMGKPLGRSERFWMKASDASGWLALVVVLYLIATGIAIGLGYDAGVWP